MIELRNVEQFLNGETRLKNVNLTINDGDVVGIIGPSGSGKSLILRTMALLNPPTKGEVIFDGEVLNAKAKDINFANRKIGMCFQDPKLFNHLTVIENVMRPQMDIYHVSKQAAYDYAIALLKKVGLRDKMFAYPDQLTIGEKQRVAIIQVIALDPKIILFDDPTSNMDEGIKREIEKVVQGIANLGNTIVLVTSDISFAKKLCNRMVYVDEKTIYEEGTKKEFFSAPKREKTINFLRGVDELTIQIENQYFDFLGVSSRITKFANANGFGQEVINKMYACFEELGKNIIINELAKKGSFSMKIVFNYDRAEKKVIFKAKYTGTSFDPKDGEDELAFLIFNHSIGGYTYEEIDEGKYKNKVTIEIPLK